MTLGLDLTENESAMSLAARTLPSRGHPLHVLPPREPCAIATDEQRTPPGKQRRLSAGLPLQEAPVSRAAVACPWGLILTKRISSGMSATSRSLASASALPTPSGFDGALDLLREIEAQFRTRSGYCSVRRFALRQGREYKSKSKSAETQRVGVSICACLSSSFLQ